MDVTETHHHPCCIAGLVFHVCSHGEGVLTLPQNRGPRSSLTSTRKAMGTGRVGLSSLTWPTTLEASQ